MIARLQKLISESKQRDILKSNNPNDSKISIDIDNVNLLETVKFNTPLSFTNISDTNPSTSSTAPFKTDSGPYLTRENGIYKKSDSGIEIVTQKTKLASGVLDQIVLVNVPESIPTCLASKKQEKVLETTGSQWFDMKAPEITHDIKRELLVLKSRGALDPKRFYKRESKALPKFFQFGTIIEGKTDYYSSRVVKKERKQTIVESLMVESEKKEFLKRKFLEIQDKKKAGGKKYYDSKQKKKRS